MAWFVVASSVGSAHSLAGLAFQAALRASRIRGSAKLSFWACPDNLMPVVDRRIAGGSLELRTLHPLPCFAGGCRAVFVAVKNRHRYPPELGISESGRESADVAKTIHDVAARGMIGGNEGADKPEKGRHE